MSNTVKAEKEGAGVLFICKKTLRMCLALRAPHKSYGLCWSLWGGMIEEGESPKDCLYREFKEEMGFVPCVDRLYPFDIYHSKDGHFKYYTFVCIVNDEFIPILNNENCGYAWLDYNTWPKPMHTGAKRSFCNKKAKEKLKLIVDQYTQYNNNEKQNC